MSESLGAGLPETVDREGTFPRLDEGQRETVRALGEVRQVEQGEILFRPGDRSYDFFVVESGTVLIVEGHGHENRVIGVHGEGRFLGELSLLTGEAAFLSAVVRDAGAVIQVPAERLREVVARDASLSNVILHAFIQRRSLLIDAEVGMKLIGSRFSPEARRLREFLTRNRVAHGWIDVESDADAETLLQTLGVTTEETPIVLTGRCEVMRNPSVGELAVQLGVGAAGPPPALCDVVVVGAGPAGLAASVYGASEGLDTQAVEAVALGGQAGTSSLIENYLGFAAGVSGQELTAIAATQARKFGARLVVPGQAVGLDEEDGHYVVRLADGGFAAGRTVVVATGAQYLKPDVEGIEDFEGLGVYYAATQMEAKLCENDPVLIVGGGNSAGQAAMFLSGKAASCNLMIRGGDLGKSMSRYLVDQIDRNDRLGVMCHSEVRALNGNGSLESVVIADGASGEEREVPCKALFIFIGAAPHTDWLRGQVAMDEKCFVKTGRDVQGEDLAAFDGERPYFLETSRPGVFAVGDVHAGSIKRVASAVGEGSMAIRLVHQRIAEGVVR